MNLEQKIKLALAVLGLGILLAGGLYLTTDFVDYSTPRPVAPTTDGGGSGR